jgi:phosphatidylserine/phosphatidylglycerophosphate/cardiolipin synthase-like enzyme
MPVLDEDETLKKVNYGLSTSIQRVWITSPWVSVWIIDKKIKQKDARLVVRLSDKTDLNITDFERLKQLNNEGIWMVRCHPNLHSKMYIFDEFCIIGSSNLTSRGMGKSSQSNRETSVLLESKGEIQDASARFLEIWNESTPINGVTFSFKIKPVKVRGIRDILRLFKPHNPFERFKNR